MLAVCGNCSGYIYEGDNYKGYCTFTHHYYYPDAKPCYAFKEGTENVYGTEETGSGTDCFLTTACCEWKGLPDDCPELTDLRRFRDCYLQQTPEGRALVTEYYRIAPGIVDKLKASPEKDRWMRYIYQKIQSVRTMIHSGQYDEAVEAYRLMVMHLQAEL